MRKHVVFVALSSSLLSVAAPALGQGPPHTRPTSLAGVLESPSAWVLRVPLKLTLPDPTSRPAVTFAAPSSAADTDALERYPDPRRMPIRRFHLEYRLEREFAFAGAPLASRIAADQLPRAWQALDVLPARTWQSDLVLRFPRDLYAGAAAEERTTAPRSLFVVAGQNF
jgi:hypothetical protein